MTNQNSETSPAMQRAIALLKAGQTVQAEEMMVQAVRAAEKQFGPHGQETATAWNELGTILLNVNNFSGAVNAYRRACSGPMPTDRQALRDRLTFLMNLGMALEYADQLDEAEEVLRQGLAGRQQYYGVEHAGCAFGLEPLAALLLRRGKIDEALKLFGETVANFWRNGHPRVATALALRAEALKRAGSPDPPFAGAEQLPEEILQAIADHVVSRTREADPGILSKVLQDLVPVLRQRFGPDHGLVVHTLIWIVNLESMRGKEGDLPVRLQTAREVIASQDRLRKPREAMHSTQGLALALADAGLHDEAVAAYRDAAERARQLGDPALRSQLHRNFGLLLAELKRDPEAEVELRAAVQDARRSPDKEMLSRAEIALGIFFQHHERLQEARPLLSTALQHIDPAHADAVVARSHLQALESGKSCGCDHQGQALADAFREFVLGRLPQDLLERFEVRLQDNDFKIEVQLNREPEQEELEHLNRVINHALGEFRKKLLKRS
jgi:tetratricopeptide (TPR) repeat protein